MDFNPGQNWGPVWWSKEEAWPGRGEGFECSEIPSLRRRGCCAPLAGAAGGRPPQQVPVPWQRREFPGRGGRKRPQPSSRLRKQNPIPVPGEQNGRKATPGQRHWAPRETQESLLFPGQRTVSRRDYTELKGPEIGPALPAPRALSAGRSRRAQRSGLHSRPPPLFPLRKPGGSHPPRSVAAAETPEAGLEAPGIHGSLKIHPKAPPPRVPLGPPAFCPQSRWLPQTWGGGIRGEAGAPSPFWFPLSLQQLLPNEPQEWGRATHPPPPSHTPRGQKTGKGGGGRADEAGAGSEAPARRELTCK